MKYLLKSVFYLPEIDIKLHDKTSMVRNILPHPSSRVLKELGWENSQ